LPSRFSDEQIFVAGKDRAIPREALETMRSSYYGLQEWDNEGRPTDGLCKKLNIERR